MLDLALDEINVFHRIEINVKERRLSFPPKLCDIMETVWTEPTSSSPSRPSATNGVTNISHKEDVPQSPRDYFDNLCDTDCQDELFLLPESVLNMDSEAVREDLSRIAMSFGRPSPHNSLDSTDSGMSLRFLEDQDGFHLARASDDCRTLWICK